MLFNFHIFVNFLVFLLLSISSFIPLWSEKILGIITISLVREDFHRGGGDTGACCDPRSSGAGCQVQGHVVAPGLGERDGSLTRAVGFHSIVCGPW